MPRPPQTESRSTPSLRATSSTLAPSATSSRLPDGVKTILCEPKFSTSRPAAYDRLPAGSGNCGFGHLELSRRRIPSPLAGEGGAERRLREGRAEPTGPYRPRALFCTKRRFWVGGELGRTEASRAAVVGQFEFPE